MARLDAPVTKTRRVAPAARASSTAYWISGLSTTGSISLGLALVAGRKRVPRPATGNTAVRMCFMSLARLTACNSLRSPTPADSIALAFRRCCAGRVIRRLCGLLHVDADEFPVLLDGGGANALHQRQLVGGLEWPELAPVFHDGLGALHADALEFARQRGGVGGIDVHRAGMRSEWGGGQ